MDDLLVKYQDELRKTLGSKWNMYALNDEAVIIVYKEKQLSCKYKDEYEIVETNVMHINLALAKYSYTPAYDKQPALSKAILLKLAGEFMIDYNKEPRLKLLGFVFKNIKKINENLISFDVFYNDHTILTNVEWNGSNLKSLKIQLLDLMVNNLGSVREKHNKDILELCKMLNDDKCYCRLKGLVQKVLGEE